MGLNLDSVVVHTNGWVNYSFCARMLSTDFYIAFKEKCFIVVSLVKVIRIIRFLR